MVDVTFRIIWWRLGEGYKNMAEKSTQFLQWYSDFSWRRVDILDMLFLGWIVAAFVVVGAINLYLRFFGLPKRQGRRLLADGSLSPLAPTAQGAEACNWINCLVNWIFTHYNSTPEFVDTWLKALNEQAKKQAGDTQLKFEQVHSDSAPPKITHISADTTTVNKDSLTLWVNVDCTEMTLLVSCIQQSSTSLKMASCDVCVLRLRGQLRVYTQYANDEMLSSFSFPTPPELKIQVRPRNMESKIDSKTVEGIARTAINGAVTNLVMSTRGGFPSFFAGARGEHLLSHQSPTYGSQSNRPIPGGDRRLMVKVIKANGLGDKDFGSSDPYAVCQLDEPLQKHNTSVVKNTVNPFWDEQFVFDLSEYTGQIQFEIFDRAKTQGNDFLGRATIPINELQRMPSSRQIIPLIGKPGGSTPTAGSITVEFLFIDNQSPHQNATQSQYDSSSPRRQIETSRRMAPGGTMVTTTTTLTEKNRDHRYDQSYDGQPNVVQKTDYNQDYSSYGSNQPRLTAHDAALTASQVGAQQAYGSPKLTLTQPEVPPGGKGRSSTMPKHHMTHSSPMDENRDAYSMSTTSSEPTREMKKSKSFASAFKKRFGRPKKGRSQSADRAASMREGSLLKPPEQGDHTNTNRTAEDLDHGEFPDGTLRKARSHSFSSSLKKLFKKKGKGGKDSVSRESSVSRASARDHYDVSREGSVNQQSPQLSYGARGGRQATPDARDYQYSTSVPPSKSPLYGH